MASPRRWETERSAPARARGFMAIATAGGALGGGDGTEGLSGCF